MAITDPGSLDRQLRQALGKIAGLRVENEILKRENEHQGQDFMETSIGELRERLRKAEAELVRLLELPAQFPDRVLSVDTLDHLLRLVRGEKA
jgi:hypothetical protein